MNDPVDWLRRVRARGLFAGMGYAAVVTLSLMVSWDLDDFVSVLVNTGFLPALKEAGFFWLTMCLHQLPTVPMLTAGINLAPSAGVRRYLWLIALGLFIWFFCTMCFFFAGELDSWNEQYAVMIAMIIAACVYRSSARTASTQLVQRRTESAVLDADVKRARLQLLRAQIEPHFLFNTLATVRTLARIDRPAAIDMLDNLMRYLSEALPKLRQEQSSLADEMQLIDAYLRIHQIRMGRRLSYELQIPPQLAGERIPSMILLTLVENAVKHGINPAVEGGMIRVTATREQASLVLRVADSGQGLAVTDGFGMGLANIRRRLTMLYGDRAVLSLSRPSSRGVVATVSIPLEAA
jgi:two-component sensor histidine kinase